MGIVVIGDVFIDIKGYSTSPYIPQGRNAGTILQIHGGVGRNVVEDIANVELEPTFVGLVDNDAMGEDVIQKLKRHKVDTVYCKVSCDLFIYSLCVLFFYSDVQIILNIKIKRAPNYYIESSKMHLLTKLSGIF